jgi:hypothetical protein
MLENSPNSGAFTFGVEFEFSLAFYRSNPHPESRTYEESCGQTLYFEPSEEDRKTPRRFGGPQVSDTTIYEHIATTLSDNGYPCVSTFRCNGDLTYKTWQVDCDTSIIPPLIPNEYSWAGVEVTTPVLWFCEESLVAVTKVCELLKKTYCVDVNESTGLHVHVGNGNDNGGAFRFNTIRNLYALLWAFEPQLDRLHPAHRQDVFHAESFRGNTRKAKYGRTFRALEGILECLKAEDKLDLSSLNNVANNRGQTYNFQQTILVSELTKRTVEFRQHEGTLNGERVLIWIRTVVRLVEFASGAEFNPAAFTELLLIAQYEEIEEKSESPLCENGFTVIDLLKCLGLYRSALFYQQRGLFGPYRPAYYWKQGQSAKVERVKE